MRLAWAEVGQIAVVDKAAGDSADQVTLRYSMFGGKRDSGPHHPLVAYPWVQSSKQGKIDMDVKCWSWEK